jgi:hypothetical protein
VKINMTDLRLGIAHIDPEVDAIMGLAADENGELAFFIATGGNEAFFPLPEGLMVQLHKVLDHYLHCDECKAARAVIHSVDAAKNSVN